MSHSKVRSLRQSRRKVGNLGQSHGEAGIELWEGWDRAIGRLGQNHRKVWCLGENHREDGGWDRVMGR